MFFKSDAVPDAYNYDFATIKHSNAPVATWQGEISFCAYHGGGWRKVLRASIIRRPWPIGNHGRHQIYAAGKKVHLVVLLAAGLNHWFRLKPPRRYLLHAWM